MNRELGLMLAGVGLVLAGVAMLVDDAKDLGKFSYPGHPSPLHHWQWGLLALILGLGAAGAGALLLLRQLRR